MMRNNKKGLRSQKSKSNINFTFVLSIILFIFSIGAIGGFNFGVKEYYIKEEKTKQECEHKSWRVTNKDGEFFVRCKKCGIDYEEVKNDTNNN